MNSETIVSFHSRLKSSVSDEHARIEQTPLLKRFFAPDFEQTEYIRIITRYYGFIRPLEERLFRFAEWPAWKAEFGIREKTPWLEEDLRHFGIMPSSVSLATESRLPAVPDAPASAGCCYVLEGACLGGMHMARVAAEKFGFVRGGGASYFSSYGQGMAAHWKGFCGFLDGFGGTETAERSITLAARETFARFADWLSKGGMA